MKKATLLAFAGLLALSAGAQSQVGVENQTLTPINTNAKLYNARPPAAINRATPMRGAKTTVATVFASDTFRSNSITSGTWTTSGNTGTGTGTDSWTIATTGSNFLGTIQSTTRAGGFLFYDANRLANLYPGTQPQRGSVTSPSFDCTGKRNVGVAFQQHYRRLADTTYMDVSNNNFATFTRFFINPNNSLGGNTSTDNPDQARITITSIAANQSNVRLRFTYSGGYTGTGTAGSGGTYGWMIDDLLLLELDSIDVALSKTSITMTLGETSGLTPAGTVAKFFIDTNGFYPITNVSNLGGTSYSNALVTANITLGATNVYNKQINIANLPVNASDTLADFTELPGLKTTTTGQYLVTLNVAAPADGTLANDTQRTIFNISDSAYCVFSGYNDAAKTLNPFFLENGYYMYRSAAAGATTPFNSYRGSLIEFPRGPRKDTITSVAVAFHPITTPGSSVIAELYKFDPDTRTFFSKGRTFPKVLTSADISTFTPTQALRFVTLQVNIGSARNYTIADSGTWAVVVYQNNPGGSLASAILTARNAADPRLIGNYGLGDTVSATSFSFGQDLGNGNYGTTDDVPAIVVNFGDAKKLVSVKNLTGITIGDAFPNPANNMLRIPVSTTTGATVNVTLSNLAGQVLQTKTLGKMAAGTSMTAEFNTATLAAGTYLYTVESNGERTSAQVVIAH